MVVDLRERIDGIRQMLTSSLRGNITLTYDLPADVWPVEIDIGEFELALVNIAVNARDAMPDGGTLTPAGAQRHAGALRPMSASSKGDFVALALIRHRRPAIAPEHIAKDLRAVLHHQGGRQGHRARPLAGLRLRASVGRQPSRSRARSGRGTTITIYLPRARAALTGGRRRPLDTPLVPQVEGTVLVVEDNRRGRGRDRRACSSSSAIARCSAENAAMRSHALQQAATRSTWCSATS